MPRTRRSRPAQSQKSSRVTRRTPIESEDGGTQIETVTTTPRARTRRVERRTPISTGGSQFEVTTETEPTEQPSRQRRPITSYSPTRAGEQAGGVALLEAEFIGCLFVLVLLLFADTSKSYGDKIMSTLKRGTLLCILFFILALVAGAGPNANKIAKAIGGLVFVAIILTSPVTAVIGDFDTFMKQDWVATGEHGTDVGSSSTSPPASSTGSGGGPLEAAKGAIERITQLLLNTPGIGIIK